MTQREQYAFVKRAKNTEKEAEAATILRLAIRARNLAAKEGIDLTMEAAIDRVQENLAHVRKMAEGVR